MYFLVPHWEALFLFTTLISDRDLPFYSFPSQLKSRYSRSATTCWVEGNATLVLRIEAQDIAALRAALNMFLRLVSIADEMRQSPE